MTAQHVLCQVAVRREEGLARCCDGGEIGQEDFATQRLPAPDINALRHKVYRVTQEARSMIGS